MRHSYKHTIVVFNPLYVNDICKALKKVILNPSYGTFNLGSRDYMSKAEFGISFAKETLEPLIEKGINLSKENPIATAGIASGAVFASYGISFFFNRSLVYLINLIIIYQN